MTSTIRLTDEEYYYKVDNMVLSSVQYLRKIFKLRYKSESGTDWVEDLPRITTFLESPLGTPIIAKAQGLQRTSLQALVEDWDISLLWLAIRYLGDEAFYEADNEAVTNLKNMRNDLAHHATKKITETEYKQKVEMFRSSLQVLKMEVSQIDKEIERAGVTSSVKAFESVTTKFKEAEELLKAGDTNGALNCYSEAIKMPSLLPVHLGITYEKRAEHYLGVLRKDPTLNTDLCSLAFEDVNKARELNDASWTAHYLAAQCYRHQRDLAKALDHYQRALAISPVQREIKNDLNSCKVLVGIYHNHDHLAPAMMPVSLKDHLVEMEKISGVKHEEADYLFILESHEPTVSGEDHVFRGDKHFSGWGVAQNPTEAVKHYSKAAKLKNTEGMHKLGMCYQYGYGVKQDLNEALRLYREVASMDRKTPGPGTVLKFNKGVASAQHAVGFFCEEGIAVKRDFGEAAKWYRLAMENGDGGAATDLGLLYIHGRGVTRDLKEAETCWKKGIELKDANAAASFLTFYLQEMEPEKAAEMVKVGRELGNQALIRMLDSEISGKVEGLKAERKKLEESVMKFEEERDLKEEGLTFQQRLKRQGHLSDPHLEKLKTILETPATSDVAPKQDYDGIKPLTWEVILAIQKKAVEGSETAHKIMETIIASSELLALLGEADEYSKEHQSKIVNVAYHCVGLERPILLALLKASPESFRKLKGLLSNLFEEKCNKKSDEDEKIRLCYVAINLSGSVTSEDPFAVEVIKAGVLRYPENVHYFALLSWLLAARKQLPEAVKYAEEGLQLSPDHPELLYFRAIAMQKTSSIESTSECVAACQKFVNKAPYDHRKVPEILFKISELSAGELDSSKATAEDFLKRGQDAEKVQLLCYQKLGQASAATTEEPKGKKKSEQSKSAAPKQEKQEATVLDKKPYLKSSTRKALILEHRQKIKNPKQDPEVTPKLKQPLGKKMSALVPITLKEMTASEDHIFANKIIDLTIIEDPVVIADSIHLICEDETGDVIKMVVFNVKWGKESGARFGCGCRLAVINPFMRAGAGTKWLRNDEPKCLLYLLEMTDICRFCGEEKAAQKCSKCKRRYCSRKCQELDWEELKHKLICPSVCTWQY